MKPDFRPILRIAGASLLTASLAQAIGITVSDLTPNGDSGTGTRTLSSSLGGISAPPLVPTTTYTISGLDLTSVGGGASETIAFDVTFSQTGGSGVQFNGFGNVSVTGGDNNQVEPTETITATLAINAGATTYTGPINLSFAQVRLGGFDADESYELTTDASTTTIPKGGSGTQNIDSSFFTIHPVDTTKTNDSMNLAGYTVAITAGADPSWTGGVDDSWIVSGNWTTGSVPGAGTLINFDSNSTANLATVLNQDFNVGGITVTDPTGAVSIGGTNILSVGVSGIDLSAATQDLSISAPLVLSAAQSWKVGSGRSLGVNGGVSGAFALNITGAGSVFAGAAFDPLVPITVAAGATLKMGASDVLATGASPAVNGTLDLNGTSQSVTSISGSGTIDNTAAGASQLTVTNSSLFTLNAKLQNTDGALALVKNGGGRLDLTKANTHSGGITVNAGTIRPTIDNAIGTGPITLNAGTFDSYYNNYSFLNNLILGDGTVVQTSGGHANTLTWSGPVQLTGSTTINANGNTSGITISGDVTNEGYTLTSITGGGSVGNFITGKITGAGGNLAVTGGLLEISSSLNDYTGATTVSAGTLRLGASDVLPDTTAVTLGNGVLNANNNIDTAGTLAVTGAATINLDALGALAFADSHLTDWTGGTLNITGTFVSGSSLRFGTDSNGLTSAQLALITVNGAGSYTLNSSGYLIESAGGSAYDIWKSQITNGLDLRTDDADGDGFTNQQEFLFGSSPVAGNGSLATTTASGGNLTLRWLQRESGASYTLKQSATLETGSWTPVASPTPTLDGDQTGAPTDYDYYSVTLPTGGGNLFFRIEGQEN